jgi:hypothetical protein
VLVELNLEFLKFFFFSKLFTISFKHIIPSLSREGGGSVSAK